MKDNPNADINELILSVYRDFGFEDFVVKLSTRPENYIGEIEVWDISEKALEDVLKAKNVDYKLNPGDGAFYGPKIEFSLKDSLGRVWQCGTIQVELFDGAVGLVVGTQADVASQQPQVGDVIQQPL